MNTCARLFNLLLVYLLTVILFMAIYIEWSQSQQPCTLCFLQRLCLVGVACGALLNLRFGSRMQHYAFLLINSLTGLAASLKQLFFNACAASEHTVRFLGWPLYGWMFFLFTALILAIAILLLLKSVKGGPYTSKHWGFFTVFGVLCLLLVVCLNLVSAYFQYNFLVC